MSPRINIPSSDDGGRIIIDYPLSLEFIDGISCETNEIFASAIVCSAQDTRVTLSGQTDLFLASESDPIEITVKNVRNPQNEGQTTNWIVLTYDEIELVVLERSYYQLSYPTLITYTYDALKLTASSISLTVFVGTQSDYITITPPSPCERDLKFTPVVPDGISVEPSIIEMNVGQKSVKYRISVDSKQVQDFYYISWIKTGDSSPNTYGPLLDTIVKADNTLNRIVSPQQCLNIPKGAKSVPCIINTLYSPDSSISVNIIVSGVTSGVSVIPTEPVFYNGQNDAQYVIEVADTVTTPATFTLTFEITGFNQDSYIISPSSIDISILDLDEDLPQIISIVIAMDRTFTDFTLIIDDIGTVYWMHTRKGMVPAPAQEYIQSRLEGGEQDPFYTYSDEQTGIAYVNESSHQVIISVKDLEAQSDYQIWFYFEDRSGNRISQVEFRTYQTLDRYKTSDFTVRINSEDLSLFEKQAIIESVASKMAIDTDRVEIASTISETSRIRRTQRFEQMYKNRDLIEIYDLQLRLYDDPFNPLVLNSPYQSILSLNSKKKELVTFVTNLDLTQTFNPTERSFKLPNFKTEPYLPGNETGLTSLTFVTSLELKGKILAIITLDQSTELEQNATITTILANPTSYQIQQGLTQDNQQALQSRAVDYSFGEPDTSITFYGLTSDTSYIIYVSAENSYPRYPDLMLDDDVVVLKARTQKQTQGLNVLAANILEVLSGFIWIILLYFYAHFN